MYKCIHSYLYNTLYQGYYLEYITYIIVGKQNNSHTKKLI